MSITGILNEGSNLIQVRLDAQVEHSDEESDDESGDESGDEKEDTKAKVGAPTIALLPPILLAA